MSLNFVFGADVGQFQRGMEKIGLSTKDMENNVVGGVKRVAGAFTAMLAVDRLASFSAEVLKMGSDISDAAYSVGLTSEVFQTLNNIAQDTGVQMSAVPAALSKLNQAVIEASKGSADMVKAFSNLGIVISDLKNINLEEKFQAVAVAYSQCTDQSVRLNSASRIFGEDVGRKMSEMLDIIGREKLPELIRQQIEANRVFSDETTASLNRANDAYKKFFQQIKIMTGNFIADEIQANKEFKELISNIPKWLTERPVVVLKEQWDKLNGAVKETPALIEKSFQSSTDLQFATKQIGEAIGANSQKQGTFTQVMNGSQVAARGVLEVVRNIIDDASFEDLNNALLGIGKTVDIVSDELNAFFDDIDRQARILSGQLAGVRPKPQSQTGSGQPDSTDIVPSSSGQQYVASSTTTQQKKPDGIFGNGVLVASSVPSDLGGLSDTDLFRILGNIDKEVKYQQQVANKFYATTTADKYRSIFYSVKNSDVDKIMEELALRVKAQGGNSLSLKTGSAGNSQDAAIRAYQKLVGTKTIDQIDNQAGSNSTNQLLRQLISAVERKGI